MSTATRSGLSRTGRAVGPACTSQREKVYRPSPSAAWSSRTYSGIDTHHTARSIVATARHPRYTAVAVSARTATARVTRSRLREPSVVAPSGNRGSLDCTSVSPATALCSCTAPTFSCEVASQLQIDSHRASLSAVVCSASAMRPGRQTSADLRTSKAPAQRATHCTYRLRISQPVQNRMGTARSPGAASSQRLRWSGPLWSPPPESNRRPLLTIDAQRFTPPCGTSRNHITAQVNGDAESRDVG